MKILNSLICMLILVIAIEAQTNNTNYLKVKDVGNATLVEWSYTLDSLAGLASPAFNLSPGAYYFDSTAPITFYSKNVSTYGVPIVDLYLQNVGFTTTDTMTVDTLITLGITESDTLGTSLVLNGTGTRSPALGMMKLFVRCLKSDVNSGKVTVVFPRRAKY